MENDKKIEYCKASEKDELEIKGILKVMSGDESYFDLGRFVVAKFGNEIIGCIRTKSFFSGALALSSLAVLPKYQGRGVGSALMRFLLHFEQSRPIFLLTSADKEGFYNKFNFFLIKTECLPDDFRVEYERMVNMPFAKNIQVIAMGIE